MSSQQVDCLAQVREKSPWKQTSHCLQKVIHPTFQWMGPWGNQKLLDTPHLFLKGVEISIFLEVSYTKWIKIFYSVHNL